MRNALGRVQSGHWLMLVLIALIGIFVSIFTAWQIAALAGAARGLNPFFLMGGFLLTALVCAMTVYFGLAIAQFSRASLQAEVGALLWHSCDAILFLDESGRILRSNPAAEKLFVCSPAGLIDRSVFAFLPELALHDDADCPDKTLNANAVDGRTIAVRVLLCRLQNGHSHWIVRIADLSVGDMQDKAAIQQRLQIALEAASLGIWELDSGHKTLVWDRSMHVLYGANPDTFLPDYETWLDRIYPEDLQTFENSIRDAFATGNPPQCEFRVVRADGSLRYMVSHGRLVNENGEARIIGVNFDVTARKKVELSLRLSEERFVLAAEAAQEGIWDWDLRTGQIWFSAQWKAHFGYQDHELPNTLETWSRLILPDDEHQSAFDVLEAFSHDNNETHEMVQRFRHKDGHIVHIRSRAVHIKDEAGFIMRMVGSHADITEQLRQEEALRQSRETLDLAIGSAHLGTWDWDLSCDRIVFGGSWDYVRIIPGEVFSVHQLRQQAVHPDDGEALLAACDAHLHGHNPKLDCEVRLHGRRGWQWAQIVGQVARWDLDGKPLRMLGVLIDIDERKRNEEALQEARRLAEMASRTKSEFLANMSHEIRTPLNAVIGFSTLLADTELNRQQHEFTETIRTAGDSLLSLINDLLDFSKIEAGKLEFEQVEFDARTTLEDTLEIITEKALAKGLDIACLVDPGVPRSVIGDPARLRQILLNLLNNAVKFTESGEVVARARASVLDEGSILLHVEVSDTGIGIEQDTVSRLFNPFTQADASTTRRFGGTGLGLSICKRLVEAMGGSIGVESETGKGSTFWFEIRMRQGSQVAMEPPLPLDLHGKSVLVLDDFAANRELLRLQLDILGLKAECFESPSKALNRLDEADADFVLAIVDMQMPDMNGLMFAEQVRNLPRWHDLPLVLLTSLAIPGQAAQARAAHFSAYLAKPVRQAQLLFCVQEALRLKEKPETERPLLTAHTLAERLAAARPHVLLAEDNLVNQKVAVLMLERIGCRVDVVENGRLALDAVREHDYAVVLMDCQMPEMDGYSATLAIRSLPDDKAKIPIVAMTANAFKSDVDRCMAVGMNAFVAKPVSPQLLRDALLPFLQLESATSAPIGAVPQKEEHPVADELAEEIARIQTAFTELQETLGMDMRDELLMLFYPTLNECLTGMEAAIKVGGADAIYKHAHKLKGCAGQLGARHLAELAKEIEQLGREAQLDPVRELLPKLRTFADALADQLKNQQSEE